MKLSILTLSREQVQGLIESSTLTKVSLKHYDICKAMASGTTQEKAAEVFGVADDRHIRWIKRKCPDCGRH